MAIGKALKRDILNRRLRTVRVPTPGVKRRKVPPFLRVALAGLVAVLGTGCSTTSIEHRTYDSRTGVETREVFVGYFNGWSYVVPDELGIEGVVELGRRSIGRSGLGEKILPGSLMLHFYNQTPESIEFKLEALRVRYSDYPNPTHTIELDLDVEVPPESIDRNTRITISAGTLPVYFYETELELSGEAWIGGKKWPITVLLKRLTADEFRDVLTEYREAR